MGIDVPPDIRDNVILRPLWDSVHEGGNRIVLVNGLPRTGKSYFALNAAYQLYRGPGPKFEHLFDCKKHLAFSKLDFQKMVQRTKHVGAALVWDEAGVAELGAHARQFWSEGNIALSTLFQIMGFHNQIAFITLPMKIMLDKHLRMLSHATIETTKINKRKKRCYARFSWNEMTSMKGREVISKHPRFVSADGVRHKAGSISIPLPPKEIVKEYEARSHVFKNWLEQKLVREAEVRSNVDKKGGNERVVSVAKERFKTAIEAVVGSPEKYWDKKRKTLDIATLIVENDISREEAYVVRASAMMKLGKFIKNQ